MFSRTYEMRYGDYKDFEQIKVSSVLDLVQDVSICHSDACGSGLDALRKIRRAWLLQGLKLHLDRPVRAGLPITLRTAVKNLRSITSERGCLIEQAGEVVGKTVASWFFFDTALMKPTRIPEDFENAYGLHDFEDDFFTYQKPTCVAAEPFDTVRISNKELDTNCHLNNQKSAELLMDALPFDYYFTDMTIYYRKAAFLGDRLALCRQELPNGWYACLQSEEGELYVAATFTNDEEK